MKISIAGGGPAGLIAALYLSRIPEAGITVHEKQTETDYRSSLCAEGISLERLKQLKEETGFDSTPFIARRVRGVRVTFPNRRHGVVLQEGATLKRTEWLRGMIAFLRRRKVTILFSSRFPGQDDCENGWLVAADGPASKLRAGIGGRAEMVPAAQYRMRLERPADLFEVFVGRMFRGHSLWHGYGWIFPKSNGLFNVGVGGGYELLDRFIKICGINGAIEEKAAAPIAINGTLFEKGRLMLIGDAAGLTNPVTCGGLSAIICCAGFLRKAVSSDRPGTYTRLIKRHRLFPAWWNRRQHVFYPDDDILNRIGDMCGNRPVNPPQPASLARLALDPRIWLPCLNLARFLPVLKQVSW